MQVQIFGVKKDPDTRKALRFFSERRVKTHFVDLKEKPATKGELRRFVEKFGVDAVVDRESRRFQEMGLASAHRSDSWWLDTLPEEPLLLKTPLVRFENQLTIGADEAAWKEWVGK